MSMNDVRNLFGRKATALAGDRPPADSPTPVHPFTWHLDEDQFAQLVKNYDATAESMYATSEVLVQFAAYLSYLDEQKDARPFTREVAPHYAMLNGMIDDVNDMIGLLRSLYEKVAEKHRAKPEGEPEPTP